MTGVFTREEENKTPYEVGGRDHNTTTVDEGAPEFYSHHQKVRGGRKGFCLESQREHGHDYTLITDFQHCERANSSSLVLCSSSFRTPVQCLSWKSSLWSISHKKLQAFNYICTRMFIATLIETVKRINGQTDRQREGEERGKEEEKKEPKRNK